MALSSAPIQRSKSLHEQTYAALRASILSGELVPGDRLVETQIAQRLQVSRTPIREALRQLQREGLITPDTGGGMRVTAMSVVDAVQLYDCRIALEQLSVAAACQHATSTQLDALNQCVEQAEGVGRTQAANFTINQLLDLDYRFHRSIAESSKNNWLVFLLDQVFDKMALLRLQTTQHNPNVLEIRLEHRHIYDAIAQRDTDTATTAITDHLKASKVRVIQELQQITTEREAGKGRGQR